jgi:hypothetical protein
MTHVECPYVLRANGTSYLFSEFASLMAQIEYLGLEVYEIECVEAESVPMKTVRNLMSGKELEIPVDTPRSCDPSSELYWTM